MRGITRSEAALQLLNQWPAPPNLVASILKNHSTPTIIPVSDAVKITLERRLQKHKRKVPLSDYRKWAKSLDDFTLEVTRLPPNDQEVALASFLSRMDLTLDPLHK
jgi:hypothetical protein